VLGFVLLGAAAVYLIAFLAVIVVSRQDQRRSVGAIVVLGAAQYNGRPSPVLRARLEHAVALYRAHLAPRVIVTGGTSPGDHDSEAAVERRYLLSQLVPDSVIVVLPVGRSTEVSMESVAMWLRLDGAASGVASVLLVSDPFHMCRLRSEARRLHIEAYTSPTRSSPISESPRRELPYLAGEALKVPITWARGVGNW
jgi:uncharacterized SAM-binding protein YcdF (DUF218 family)